MVKIMANVICCHLCSKEQECEVIEGGNGDEPCYSIPFCSTSKIDHLCVYSMNDCEKNRWGSRPCQVEKVCIA
jgi:hypothetical protein